MKNSKDNTNTNYNPEVTKEDLETLGDKKSHLKTELSDDLILKNRTKPVDFTGKDLDVPGRTLPKDRTKSNIKDEENQLYSQGSDSNENLEQDSEHLK